VERQLDTPGGRRDEPVPVIDAVHGEDGALHGAAAIGLDQISSPTSLALWADEQLSLIDSRAVYLARRAMPAPHPRRDRTGQPDECEQAARSWQDASSA